MFKKLNLLGIISLLLTLFALFLSATLYLFIFGMLVALLALFFAHFAQQTTIVKVSQVLSIVVLLFGTTIIIFSLF